MLSTNLGVEHNLKNLYEEQMRVGMLTDEHLITCKLFKRDIKYGGTEVSNHSKTKSW